MNFREQRPDIHTSREAWERSWQEDIDKNYKPGGVLARLPSLAAIVSPSEAALLASDKVLIQMQKEVRLICKLQEDLAKQAALRSATEDFEGKWKALPDEKRREVVLEGIYRSMCVPDMESRRRWCPDSTLKYITSANGDAYLRMLKALLPTNLEARITEPILVPHPVMDRLFSLKPADEKKPGYKTFIRMYSLSRTYCLTLIVWNTFLAFHGEHENQIPIKTPSAQREDFGVGPTALRATRQAAMREHNALRKDHEYACWTCGKSETMMDGQKLKACGKCHAIGRRVSYCSRECQIQDWKSGLPQPHKLFCGKPLEEQDEKEVASEDTGSGTLDDAGIPQADPSYKRSPALLHQISLLTENPQMDYVIVYPHPKPDQGVTMADPFGRMFFLLNRTRAFRDGDPTSVQQLYKLLRGIADIQGIPRSHVRKQLEGEYGITLPE